MSQAERKTLGRIVLKQHKFDHIHALVELHLKTAERQCCLFKLDEFTRTKPMKIGKRCADVRRARHARDDPCYSVAHGLQTAQKIRWKACQSHIAIVKSWYHKQHYQRFYCYWWQRQPNVSNLAECSEAAHSTFRNVGSHRMISIDLDTEATKTMVRRS